MIVQFFLVFSNCVVNSVYSYRNTLYTISSGKSNILGADCRDSYINRLKHVVNKDSISTQPDFRTHSFTYRTIRTSTASTFDPLLIFQHVKRQLLLGSRQKGSEELAMDMEIDKLVVAQNSVGDYEDDPLAHYPSGAIMRGELFQGKKGVHLPMSELIHRDHVYLRITDDYMQTAVDAFAIILEGSLEDVLRLPSAYILRSARTIAMMRVAREKLVATWTIVKDDLDTDKVSIEMLEMYRPLFKYLNGREIARLNLSDVRILTYIGTHPDLDRHQVGVVANQYIRINPKWMEPRYLNIMNNLLCGVPMTFMRKVAETSYLQLTHQVFYHIRACDPLQRRFYLSMMTKTQVLGKGRSWNARDVSRLGLLLSEVEGSELASVNPEAMSGITAQVMQEIPAHTLQHITETQLRYIGQKPLNILAKKLKSYQDLVSTSAASITHFHRALFIFCNAYLVIIAMSLCTLSSH